MAVAEVGFFRRFLRELCRQQPIGRFDCLEVPKTAAGVRQNLLKPNSQNLIKPYILARVFPRFQTKGARGERMPSRHSVPL